jgi:putative transposase
VPQSLSNILVHVIFSTKHREPSIKDPPGLHAYMAATLKNHGCPCLIVGGTADHVHLLINLSRTVIVGQAVEKVKTSSSKMLGSGFAWQAGYAVFSVGVREAAMMRRYIEGQDEHHRTRSFQDEFRELCLEAGVALDERYAWD